METYLWFVDDSQAFDTVNGHEIWGKLIELGTSE